MRNFDLITKTISKKKDENSIVKQSLKIFVDLDHNFPGFNCNLLNKCKIKQYVDLVQKNCISYCME